MRFPIPLALLAGLLLLGWAEAACAAEGDGDLGWAEKTLAEAKIKTDGPALLKFFAQRTLSEAERKRLGGLVSALGDNRYAVRRKAYRRLLQAGPAALVHLKPAVTDSDAEIARSAEKLIQAIESGNDANLTIAAAHLLAVRKPPGSVRTLLGYLPQASDDYLAETVCSALAGVALNAGKIDPLLAAALRDPDPVRRAAAAYVYGKAGPQHVKVLTPLLADAAMPVRYYAARALVRSGDKSAVRPLLTVLGDGPLSLAWQAEDLLLLIAGDKAPRVSLGNSAGERKKCQEEWGRWWEARQARIDLAKVDFKNALRGLNLACDCDTGQGKSGRLWAFGRDGKERWNFTAVRVVVDVRLLPSGNLLLAEGDVYQVTERTREGKIVWSHKTNGYATTVRRLPSGNILLAGYMEIMEVTRAGKVVFSYKGGTIYRVQWLRNGHLVFGQNGRVMEIDRTGKQHCMIDIPGGTGIWAHVEKLDNGRYLVAQYSSNRVIELDKDGKIHWQVTVTSPSSASQLPNGNILVSAMNDRRVVEFNRAGKEVWSQKTKGRPFLVRRY